MDNVSGSFWPNMSNKEQKTIDNLFSKGQISFKDVNIFLAKTDKLGYIRNWLNGNLTAKDILSDIGANEGRFNFVAGLDGKKDGLSKADINAYLGFDKKSGHSETDDGILDAALSMWNRDKNKYMDTKLFKSEAQAQIALVNFAKNYLDLNKDEKMEEVLYPLLKETFPDPKLETLKKNILDKTGKIPDDLLESNAKGDFLKVIGKDIAYYMDPKGNIVFTDGRKISDKSELDKKVFGQGGAVDIVKKYINDRLAGITKLHGYKSEFNFDYSDEIFGDYLNKEKIKIKDNLESEKADACYNTTTKEISIDSEVVHYYKPEKIAEILLHELIHAYEDNDKEFKKKLSLYPGDYRDIMLCEERNAYEQSGIFKYTYKDNDLSSEDRKKLKQDIIDALKNY